MTERRSTANTVAKCEIRADKDGNPQYLTGYAAVFYRDEDPGTEYKLYDDLIERIQPGAFDRAISEGHDVRGLFNHDTANLLGRTSNNTCKLTKDSTGLRFEIPINPDDSDHQRVVAKVKRGDLTGCSFAFHKAEADWDEVADGERTIFIRNINDLNLVDVGPVTFPAYEATEVGLRTCVESKAQLTEARSILDAHRQSLTDHINQQNRAKAVDIDARWRQIMGEG